MALNCPQGTVKVLVKCGERTVPPHTDEINPGTCSRTKAFCLAPGAAEPDWKCWQHGGYRTQTTGRTFKDCADAVKTLAAEAASGAYAADTEAFLRYTGSVSVRQAANGRWTASTALRWSVDRDRTVINLPDISWPNMTAAENAAVQRALDALAAHEQGHIRIAEDYAAELAAGGGERLSGSGATRDEARAALDRAIQTRAQAVQAELRQRQGGYDDTTDHGRNQSEVGGEDVVLVCP